MASCVIIIPQFKVLESWAPAYAEAFGQLGYEAAVLRIDEDFFQNLQAVLRPDCRFILTFDGLGMGDELYSINLYEQLGIPLVSLYLDHTEFNYKPLACAPAGSWSGFFDRHDIGYAQKYLQSPTKYFFLTDAGLAGPQTPLPKFSERDIDVMFCGYIFDPEPTRSFWQNCDSPHVTDLFKSVAELLLTNDRLSPADAFELCMRQDDIFFDNKSNARFHSIMATMSTYGRGIRRLNLLHYLLDHGIKLHYFGYPEQVAMLNNPNVIYDGLLLGDDYFRALRRAKITINTLPLSQYALSERIPTAMLNSALAVTDTNPYMDLFYQDDRDIIAYKHSDYSALPDRIHEILNNPGKWEEMTAHAYAVTSENHTFLHRAREILDTLDDDC